MDLWDDFERAVQASGRVAREAELLTDAELLALLACPSDPDRQYERAVVEREALRRAGDARDARALVTDLSRDDAAPSSDRKRELKDALLQRFRGDPPPPSPQPQSEPGPATFRPDAFSRLPSRDDHRDAS